MIELNIWLYGKPSWDIEIEGKKFLDPLVLKEHAFLMKEHLERAAEILSLLQNSGWKLAESYGAIYSLTLYKNLNKKYAEQELQKFGISLSEIALEQVEDFSEDL